MNQTQQLPRAWRIFWEDADDVRHVITQGIQSEEEAVQRLLAWCKEHDFVVGDDGVPGYEEYIVEPWETAGVF